MLVERGQDFDPRSAVMDLMKKLPEAIEMPDSMPPVEDERSDEPVEGALSNRTGPVAERKNGVCPEVLVPG
jgi:hypothetical protein